MPALASRVDLKNYALRSLGSPVVKINVDIAQVEDRIDDAIQYYQAYHFNASERIFLTHTVTATDISNEYISVPPSILSVNRVMPHATTTGGMYNPMYQMRLSDLNSGMGIDLVDMDMKMRYINTISNMMDTGNLIQFIQHEDKIKMHLDWNSFTADETMLVFECWSAIDTTSNTRLWDDRWLKRYTTALVKRQWGANLKKMSGITLPGGVTLNGQEIYDEATNEIDTLETEMQDKFELPPDFMVG